MDNLKLRALASNPANALEIGKAAEHLVVADLILTGYRAFLSDQGLPYDVVVDVGGRLIRIQVKAACFAKNMNSQKRHERRGYTFHVRARGKRNSRRLMDNECDLVALVAIDCHKIAYLPLRETSQCVQLLPPGAATRGDYIRTRAATIDGFPFEAAIARHITPDVNYVPLKERDCLEIDGVRKKIADWAIESGVSAGRISARLTSGWSAKDAVFRKQSKPRSRTIELRQAQ